MPETLFHLTPEERMLRALQHVYRKERMGDARLTREGTIDLVWDEICNQMTPDAAVEWADRMALEIEDGNHD